MPNDAGGEEDEATSSRTPPPLSPSPLAQNISPATLGQPAAAHTDPHVQSASPPFLKQSADRFTPSHEQIQNHIRANYIHIDKHKKIVADLEAKLHHSKGETVRWRSNNANSGKLLLDTKLEMTKLHAKHLALVGAHNYLKDSLSYAKALPRVDEIEVVPHPSGDGRYMVKPLPDHAHPTASSGHQPSSRPFTPAQQARYPVLSSAGHHMHMPMQKQGWQQGQHQQATPLMMRGQPSPVQNHEPSELHKQMEMKEGAQETFLNPRQHPRFAHAFTQKPRRNDVIDRLSSVHPPSEHPRGQQWSTQAPSLPPQRQARSPAVPYHHMGEYSNPSTQGEKGADRKGKAKAQE